MFISGFMQFVIKILISSLAVFFAAYILPGVKLENYFVALLLAFVLSFLNNFVKPLLILFTIPVTIFTLGLFLLAINAFIILFADYIVDGFYVRNFWWAMIFSILVSLLTSILDWLGKMKVSEPQI